MQPMRILANICAAVHPKALESRHYIVDPCGKYTVSGHYG